MAFTAKILSWRFRHLNIVGCLLKRRPTKGGGGGGGHGPPRTPLSYAPVLCQKAPANSINSIIYMTRITTSKARNSLKSGTKVFLHVENNIYRRTCWEQ